MVGYDTKVYQRSPCGVFRPFRQWEKDTVRDSADYTQFCKVLLERQHIDSPELLSDSCPPRTCSVDALVTRGVCPEKLV